MTVRGVCDRDIIQVATEEARQEYGTMRRPRSSRISQLPEAEDEAIPNAAVIVLKIRLGLGSFAEWILDSSSTMTNHLQLYG
jgi:hypothetical protein